MMVELLVETHEDGTYHGHYQDLTFRPRHGTQPIAPDQASMCFGIKASWKSSVLSHLNKKC